MRVVPIPKQEKKEKIRVAAYCRVSTSLVGQNKSFDTQVKYYTDLIQKNPLWEFAGVFADHGISATSITKREEFKKLIKLCELGQIDMIIVKALSRFARNSLESLETIKKLEKLGVSVYFEKERIKTNTNEGLLMLSMLSVVAELEVASTSTNLKWSVKKRMENGTFSIKVPPFGYNRVDGGLVINQDEAIIVRMVVKEYLNGNGCRVIAKKLTESTYYTRKGNKKWDSSMVDKLLVNPVYRGDLLMQKTITKPNTYKVVKNFGEEAQYLIEDDHTPIISRKEAKLIDEIRIQRSKDRNIVVNTSHERITYGLSRLIKNAKSDVPYTRQVIKTNGKRKTTWHLKEKIPGCVVVDEETLLKVLKETFERISYNKKETLELYKENLIRYFTYQCKNEIELLENRIKDNYRQIYELTEQIHDSAFYYASKNELEAEIENYKNAIDNAIHSADDKMLIASTKGIIQQIDSVISDLNEYKTDSIKLIVKKIIVISKKHYKIKLVNDLVLEVDGDKYGI